jgi:translation initiation factor IF-2
MRVHELSKELGLENRDLLKILRENGIEAKSHMSSLEDEDLITLRRALALKPVKPGEAAKPATPPKSAEPPPPPPAPVEKAKEPEVAPKPEVKVEPITESAPVPATAPAKTPEPPATKAETEKKASPAVAAPKAQPQEPAKEAPKAPETRMDTPVAKPAPVAEKKAAPAEKPATTKQDAAKPAQPSKAQTPAPAPAAAPKAPEAASEDTASVADDVLRFRGGIVVRELADLIKVKPNQIVAELMKMNVFATINAKLDFDVAEKVAQHFGFEVEHEKKADASLAMPERPDPDALVQDRPEDLLPRPPVVTFLGHVDHGKTSLMDQIRKTSVVKGESGGITQHIGAYSVDVAGHSITFLDTPGHAAFTAMRARGANLTDVAVIIIAADDGIMPQTKEAIAHAKAADVAIIVAINKCDLPAANPDRVLQQLQAEGLTPEDWGGETICCKVSALTGDGVGHLLEMILLQAEMQELRANPRKPALGYIVEAEMFPGMGPTATMLVTGGTLKVGDAVLCGQYWGRVRALIDDRGNKIKTAGPSKPVKCLGLSGVPEAGAEFHVVSNDRIAKTRSEEVAMSRKTATLEAPRKVSLDDFFSQSKDDDKRELSLILKADTQGSVEAIVHSLKEIKSEKVSVRFIHAGTGNITTNDVLLGSASNAVVLGFHVSKEAGVDALAKREGVEVRLHSIIYELIDQVRDAMIGVLGPRLEEAKRGQAQVRVIFEVGKGHKVGGCLVLKGIVNIKHRVRVKRKTEVLFEGALLSLKHFQDDVKEVREAQECGIRIKGFTDFIEGDIFETYEIEEHQQTL